MNRSERGSSLTLRNRPLALRWGVLLFTSLCLIALLELIHLPAALLLGAMSAAILVASFEGDLAIPHWPYVIAQGLVACLIARSIGPDTLRTVFRQWPIFFGCIAGVLGFSTALGVLLARWKVLPGTTAVWGSAPGAATVMVLMSDGFGADMRLVAFMQFLRVVLVAAVASIVSRMWATPGATAQAAVDWFPAVATVPLCETLALAILGAVVGAFSKIPAGALLVPLLSGIVLSGSRVLVITLPPWLMAGCYALVGWAIGLRFTRDIVLHAARALPRVAASTLTLIALCGGLAWALHVIAGTGILTAYLATSPGGADSVAIIAAASNVDLPFVMAMQTARFVLVMLLGPSLARVSASWIGG